MITAIVIIESLALIILVAGFLVERSGPAPTWEEGIKKVLFFCFRWLHKESTGKDLPEYEINPLYIPTVNEIEELVRQLEHDPYDTPVFEFYDDHSRADTMTVMISAVGLYGHYQDLSGDTLIKKVTAKARQCFQQMKHPLPVYVHSATKSYCCLVFPLTDHACKEYAAYYQTSGVPAIHAPGFEGIKATVKELDES